MHILITDDDPFFQKFYQSQLIEKGYEVTVASDGEEALQAIKKHKPDIIMLDIIMPKKDGFEVLEELQKSTAHNKIPVLVFSTLGQEHDVKRALDMGAKGYVNKSFFDFDTLLAKIKEAAAS